MAQQLKFVACLKIMMEELSTLATGFEVDGGQLRYQLYIWLEKEVQVLKSICSYGMDIDMAINSPERECAGCFLPPPSKKIRKETQDTSQFLFPFKQGWPLSERKGKPARP